MFMLSLSWLTGQQCTCSAGTCHCAICIDKPNCSANPHHMMGVLQEDTAHELERAASKAEQAVELRKAAELQRVCLPPVSSDPALALSCRPSLAHPPSALIFITIKSCTSVYEAWLLLSFWALSTSQQVICFQALRALCMLQPHPRYLT